MLKLIRPEKPDDFDKASKKNFDKVKKLIDEEKKPAFNEKFWGKYKDKFFEAQYRKCAYCECIITNYGDMEHYRPKSVIEDIEEEGGELDNLNNVKGRKFKNACETGYWWLAYDWDNYLLSCSLCNQPWKRALFPIRNVRPANNIVGSDFPYRSPKQEDLEIPLLLNPFNEDFRPNEHLIYKKYGAIDTKNDSSIGYETIRTYGLKRDQLLDARATFSTKAYKFIKRFSVAEGGTKAEYEAAQDIVDMGSVKDQHAGMVRSMFESLIEEYSWEDLETYVEQKKLEFNND